MHLDLPAPLARSRFRVVAVAFAGAQAGIVLDGSYAVGVLRARAASAFIMRQPAD